MTPGARTPLALVREGPGRDERVQSVHRVAARPGRQVPWPLWADPALVAALADRGVSRPWAHQVEAAEHARAGRHVVVSTGTASGKSLAYLLPAIEALRGPAIEALRGPGTPGAPAPGRGSAGTPQPTSSRTGARVARTGTRATSLPPGLGGTVLYLSPTKALAGDQLAAVESLGLDDVRAARYDGDTPAEERRWVREHAGYVLTNPDLLHYSMLPGHARWARFLRGLRYVVVDECHRYRGVFGSHVAAVLRRLRRVAARYGASPVFVLASATTADPARTATRLTGLDVVAVTEDASRRGATDLVLWEPPLQPGTGENGAPTRRSATSETADLLADLVSAGVPTLAFVRSRRGAEAVALATRRLLAEVDPSLPDRVASYRSGYLPEERRAIERALRDGRLLGVASTNALELGIDVSGLDAVLIAGWPGTLASLWQQAGRAGRAGGDALVVLVARDDPLDTYLVRHPEAVLGRPVEATVLDPDNPHVLAPHLAAAAAELPLTEADLPLFGPRTAELLEALVRRGLLRRRPGGWFWTHPTPATDLTDLRGTGGDPVQVVEAGTGRVLGTVDAASADHTVHDGAVYLHRGAAHVVERLDLEDGVALVRRDDPGWSTQARSVTDLRVVEQRRRRAWGDVALCLGTVDVTTRVTSFVRRQPFTGTLLGEEPLDLPPRTLRTTAVWWVLPEPVLRRCGLDPADVPGSLHAAEHAAIGLLPLLSTCDRWDVGGLSTALHPDTGTAAIFVHDGHPGGAGFAERGFLVAQLWLRATLDTVAACECEHGCPSCVQSPKCGNGNEPLDKAGAGRLLQELVDRADDAEQDRAH